MTEGVIQTSKNHFTEASKKVSDDVARRVLKGSHCFFLRFAPLQPLWCLCLSLFHGHFSWFFRVGVFYRTARSISIHLYQSFFFISLDISLICMFLNILIIFDILIMLRVLFFYFFLFVFFIIFVFDTWSVCTPVWISSCHASCNVAHWWLLLSTNGTRPALSTLFRLLLALILCLC